MVEAAVIGAGLWGASAAATLVEHGMRDVMLLEANDGPAQESSAKSGCILGDVVIHPGDFAYVQRSRYLYDTAARLSGEGALLRQVGLLALGGPADLGQMRRHLDDLRGRSVPAGILEREQLRRAWPALDRLDAGAAALWTPLGAVINPTGYAAFCVEQGKARGLRVQMGQRVRTLRPEDGAVVIETDQQTIRARRVLVSTGTWTRKLLSQAGLDIAMRPYRTQLASVALDGEHGLPVIHDFGQSMYTVPENPTNLLVGDGTELTESDPDDYRTVGDAAFEESVARRLLNLTSLAETAGIRRAWAGLCGATPDKRPLIGMVAERVFCACGGNGSGVGRGPALGEMAALTVLGEGSDPDFDPRRFAPGHRFEIRPGSERYAD